MAPRPSTTCRRSFAAAASSALMRLFSTLRSSMPKMKSRAAAEAPSAASYSTAVIPPVMVTCAMPRPIAPAPSTPTVTFPELKSRAIGQPLSALF